MIASEAGFTLAAAPYLWLGALAVVVWFARRGRSRGIEFAAPASLASLPVTWRARCAALPQWLTALAMLSLLLALAQPVQVRPLPPMTPGSDLMLCLDSSSSMAAEDLGLGTTRFDLARRLAAQFVGGRHHDRLGVVAFARYSDLRCPLTGDRDTVVRILEAAAMVEPEGKEDATAIGAAVGTAAQALVRGGRKGRVVVLVTDGEENVALPGAEAEIAPLHAAQLCRQEGIRVHAIVVGAGNRKADGRTVPIDTTAVQQLTRATGGRFYTATDAQALASVYAAIDAMEQSPVVPAGMVAVGWWKPALAVGLLLLAAARLLAATWLRRMP